MMSAGVFSRQFIGRGRELAFLRIVPIPPSAPGLRRRPG